MAATAVRGTQQIDAVPDPLYDGVFGAWYGKGPGVDRAGDALIPRCLETLLSWREPSRRRQHKSCAIPELPAGRPPGGEARLLRPSWRNRTM